MTRSFVGLLAATLIGVAAGVVGLAAPAQAAGCPAGTGVTVVVNSSVGCDANGGGVAASNFADAGHQLNFASRSPGFVCRVDGIPASDPCTVTSPSDAYWGLFWSDGTSGKWSYASLGVGSLKVPKGGGVAFVFQNSSTKTWPSVSAPMAPTASAQPTAGSGGSTAKKSKPTAPKSGKGKKPRITQAPVGVPSASAPTDTATATPSASASTPSSTPTTKDTVSPASDAPAAADESAASADPVPSSVQESVGFSISPAAAAAGVAVLLVLAGAGVVVWRRRQGT